MHLPTETTPPSAQLSPAVAEPPDRPRKRGSNAARAKTEGEAGEASIRKMASQRARKTGAVRDKVLKICLSAEELNRLPHNACRGRWARHVVLEAAAGKRTVGADLETIRHANGLRAWLGALLDQLSRQDLPAADRAATLAEAADLMEQGPVIFSETGGGS